MYTFLGYHNCIAEIDYLPVNTPAVFKVDLFDNYDGYYEPHVIITYTGERFIVNIERSAPMHDAEPGYVYCTEMPCDTAADVEEYLAQVCSWMRHGVELTGDTCGKCGGTGKLPWYSHIMGGVCFACKGSGKA